MTKLIYIGGYGHSGSTLLEYLLTGCTELVACGEVASVVRDRLKKKHCTCGRRSEACPIWSQVLSSGAPLTEKTHEALTLALLAHAGKRFDLMVDSTKTALGHALAPFRLRRALGKNFLLVHLVRDPRAVAWSAIKKTERRKLIVNRPLYCARVALAWSAANLACEIFGLFHPKQYLRLRYEDFVAAPRQTLDRIFQRVLPGAKWYPETLGVTDNRHQLYGNRMRGKPLALEDVKEDRAWQTDMPASYRRVVSPLSAILRARYFYS
jgi:hypothetical protein